MPRALLVLTLAALSCAFGVAPDQGRFSCEAQSDCGDGYQCVPQLTRTAGLCFPVGTCTAETCDGQDNDCNGVADDGVCADAGP